MKPFGGVLTKEMLDEAYKKLQKASTEALIYGKGWTSFSIDPNAPPLEKNGGIYSGILKKYIDPKTGEPIEDVCKK